MSEAKSVEVSMSKLLDGINTVFNGVVQMLGALDPPSAAHVVEKALSKAAATNNAEAAAATPTTDTNSAAVATTNAESAAAVASVSLEDVRAVLAEISRGGKTAQMKALLAEFGATKLSDVDPTHYTALLLKAKEI